MGDKQRMSEAERDYRLAYATALINRRPICPWNPFPRNSPWGRAIEEGYQRQTGNPVHPLYRELTHVR